ncbi:MAG: hypothetical protein QOI34_1784 [Verrucomicrobiota bacterium]
MKYHWKDAGEEWSERWGTSEAQWTGSILPRIRECLPANTILEIGPGYGRWTHYLKDHCQRLWVVDRAAECIEACRSRFADDPRVTGHVNQGGSLAMFPVESIDFVFSFDVFVHIKRDIVEEYLREFARTLKIGGKGFIHHSNLGAYQRCLRRFIPRPITKLLIKLHILDEEHHRTPTMSAEVFRELCARHGLHCLKQELVNWRGRRLIDCFSLFERTDSKKGTPTEILRNPGFMKEAAEIRERTARLLR